MVNPTLPLQLVLNCMLSGHANHWCCPDAGEVKLEFEPDAGTYRPHRHLDTPDPSFQTAVNGNLGM